MLRLKHTSSKQPANCPSCKHSAKPVFEEPNCAVSFPPSLNSDHRRNRQQKKHFVDHWY